MKSNKPILIKISKSKLIKINKPILKTYKPTKIINIY